MNIVITAKFSSHTQTEQSIEDQSKVCYEYARAHGFNVIEEYIDRSQSGTSDNRSNFQRVMSAKSTIEESVINRSKYTCTVHYEKCRNYYFDIHVELC